MHGLDEFSAGQSGPAPKRIVTGYGFWIFLLSDMVMFSCFFAAYAVLSGQTAGGPSGAELFNLKNVAIETGCLLLSSFACGMASIAADERNKFWFQISMAVTGLLGLGFLVMEIREFSDLVARGAGPTRSAFLSAFFTLVGCHGLHVTAGILWLLTMMAQVLRQGFPRRHPAPLSLLRAVLARARHHLGRGIFGRLSAREHGMSDRFTTCTIKPISRPAMRSDGSVRLHVIGYLVGLGLAVLLTATSFFVAGTDLVWQPSIPIAIIVLAIAQMGVHIVFFLHITTGPDNTNNVMALAFGVLIVVLVVGGSLWIMANLNQNMMPMDQLMQMQR